MKLLFKIPLVIIVGAITAIIALSIVVSIGIRDSLEKSIGENQLEIARQIIDKVDRLLYERFVDIQEISNNDTIEAFFLGEVTVDDATDRLKEIIILSGQWDHIFIIDTNENVVASTKKNHASNMLQLSHERLAYWHAIQGDVYYTDAVILLETGRITIIYASPIYDKSLPGRPIIGVAMGYFSWQIVIEILEEIERSVRLYNKTGALIGSNRPQEQRNLVFKNYYHNVSVKDVLRGESTSLVGEGILGNEALISYVPEVGYLDLRGNAWGVILELPAEIVFVSMKRAITGAILILIFVIFFMSVGIVGIIFNFVIRPIISLTHTAEDIAGGDIDKKAIIYSKDEIGILAGAFNTMTKTMRMKNKEIQSSKDKIEEKVEELEKFQRLTVGRELKMIELKGEIKKLSARGGFPPEDGQATSGGKKQ